MPQVPVTGEGMPVPLDLGNGYYEYDVTQQQEQRWNNMSSQERKNLVDRSIEEHKDLRGLL
jgi:hypothetical protein